MKAKKALGQHFLVDENVLGVIGRLAKLDPEDVVLEVGPGHGVLTRFLAERVRVVHAVEVDRSLEEPLADALAGVENVTVTFGDAVPLKPGTTDIHATITLSARRDDTDLHQQDPCMLCDLSGLCVEYGRPVVACDMVVIPAQQQADRIQRRGR